MCEGGLTVDGELGFLFRVFSASGEGREYASYSFWVIQGGQALRSVRLQLVDSGLDVILAH